MRFICIDVMVQVQVPPRPALTLIIDGGDGARRPVFEPASQTPAGPLPRPTEQPLPKISLDHVRDGSVLHVLLWSKQTERSHDSFDSIDDGFARSSSAAAAGPPGVRQARHALLRVEHANLLSMCQEELQSQEVWSLSLSPVRARSRHDMLSALHISLTSHPRFTFSLVLHSNADLSSILRFFGSLS